MKTSPSSLRLAAFCGLALASCALTAVAQDAGRAVLFTRPYLDPIYQEDAPSRDEAGQPVRIAATPGEYEPASVGVRAVEAMAGAKLNPTDLVGPQGARIPKDRIEVLITSYINPAEGKYAEVFRAWPRLQAHPLHPAFLTHAKSADVAAGKSQQFWVTVHIPDNLPRGMYKGDLVLSDATGEAGALPISVEVYPFKLAEARPSYFLAGDNWPLSDASFENSRSHGMNTICINQSHPVVIGTYENSNWTFPRVMERISPVVITAQKHGLGKDRPIGISFREFLLNSGIPAMRKAGITADGVPRALDPRMDYWLFYDKPEPVEVAFKFHAPYYPVADPCAGPTTVFGKALYLNWVQAMRTVNAGFEAKGWRAPWYWVAEDPQNNRGEMRVAMLMCNAAHDAGADSFVTCNEATVSEPNPKNRWHKAVGPEPDLLLERYLKIRCYPASDLGPETLERTRKVNAVYSTRVNASGNQPASTRFQVGCLAWRLGLDSVMISAFVPIGADVKQVPRDYLRDWEAVREGVDDLKYLEALEAALKSGKGDPGVRQAAMKVLDDVRAAIPITVREIGYVDDVTGLWVPGTHPWSAGQYDDMRRKVAQATASLTAEVR